MARRPADKTDRILVQTILEPLCGQGAALRPGLDERGMILTLRHAGISLAKRWAASRSVTWTISGWSLGRPLAMKIFATAASLQASAAKP